MNVYLKTAKKYLKNPWIIAALILVVIIVFFSLLGRGAKTPQELVLVKQGTVREEVSVTGKVKAAQAVNLSFEKSGKVVKINKNVNDEVSAGDIILQIDNSDLAAQLAQAQAALRFQNSKLSELEAGTRPEALSITETKTKNAKTDFDNARTSMVSALQNAYASVDDAVRGKIDEFFINPRSTNPQVAFVSNVTAPIGLETGRVEVEKRLQNMRDILASITLTTDLGSVLNTMKLNLGEIKLFMDNLSLAVNSLEPTTYLSQTTITSWKSDMSLARTSVNSAITNVLATEDKYNTARSAYTVASGQLNLDKSGAVSQELEAQRAQVAEANANVSAVLAQLAKTYIRAPIDGIVTRQETTVGETVLPNTVVAAVMSEAAFEIEANIPEADIAKVKTGQTADVTLDAYSSDVVFEARVVRVDPAETIVDGVPTYKTIFQFENADERIKSGMTANVDILGETHDNVLYIPQRAVVNKNGLRTVTVKAGDTTKEVAVKTGLRGYDGSVEILSGLNIGDEVVVSQK